MASFVSTALGLGRRSTRTTVLSGGSGLSSSFLRRFNNSTSIQHSNVSLVAAHPKKSLLCGASQRSMLVGATQARTQTRSFMAAIRPQAQTPFLFQYNPSALVPSSRAAPCNLLQKQQQRGMASKKHKRIVKLAKGYRGRSNRCYRIAIRRVEKAWQYAYRDRKVRRRDFRKLWITRVAAGVRQHSLSYSRFIHQLNSSPVVLDRKVLANLASQEPFSFKAVVDVIGMTHEANAHDQAQAEAQQAQMAY